MTSQCANVDVGLTAVPETMLWTLHNRCHIASRPDGWLKDPKALEIYKSIDYDYEKSFGPAEPSHAIRSLVFDGAVLDFWKAHPQGTVVNLGEGLETQRFRLAEQRDPKALWVTVDLESAIKAREKFISADEMNLHVAASATDTEAWMPLIPKDKPVFITAQGLFMYLPEEELKTLFQTIAKTFPGSKMWFDSLAKWMSNKTMSKDGWQKTKTYTTPQMPFGVNKFDAEPLFQSWVPGLDVQEIDWPLEKNEDFFSLYIVPILFRLPYIRGFQPGMLFQVVFPFN